MLLLSEETAIVWDTWAGPSGDVILEFEGKVYGWAEGSELLTMKREDPQVDRV